MRFMVLFYHIYLLNKRTKNIVIFQMDNMKTIVIHKFTNFDQQCNVIGKRKGNSCSVESVNSVYVSKFSVTQNNGST